MGVNMFNFKIDGKYLRERSGSKLGEFDGKYIRNSNGSRVGEINGKYIRDSHGTRIAEFDGKYIRDNGNNRIGTIEDVRKEIDGPGGMSLVAFWLFFIR
jgi:sporulation protein YlmC with PRC-barrel domain